jgi:hypothetical protein
MDQTNGTQCTKLNLWYLLLKPIFSHNTIKLFLCGYAVLNRTVWYIINCAQDWNWIQCLHKSSMKFPFLSVKFPFFPLNFLPKSRNFPSNFLPIRRLLGDYGASTTCTLVPPGSCVCAWSANMLNIRDHNAGITISYLFKSYILWRTIKTIIIYLKNSWFLIG